MGGTHAKHSTVVRRFEEYLRQNQLKLTPQRRRIFERAFSTRDHFSAEQMYEWLRDEGDEAPRVSRATVYRTLDVLAKGGFVESLDTGRGELVYENAFGQEHHDHMVCEACGRIEEFHDERIEALQLEAAAKKGFRVTGHVHRLTGVCRACAKKG